LSWCGEVDSGDASTEASGVDSENQSSLVIVVVVFVQKDLNQIEHRLVLLGKQYLDAAGKFRWRLERFVEFKNQVREWLLHVAKVGYDEMSSGSAIEGGNKGIFLKILIIVFLLSNWLIDLNFSINLFGILSVEKPYSFNK